MSIYKKNMSIDLKSSSILQNNDISLYKVVVNWLSRIYICQNTLVCSHISEARVRLLMLLGARSREVSTCYRSHTSPIYRAKAPFEPTAGLCTRYYFGRSISKRVVVRNPKMHTNTFIGTARMLNINVIIKVRCKM